MKDIRKINKLFLTIIKNIKNLSKLMLKNPIR